MPHKCHTFNSHYGLSKSSFFEHQRSIKSNWNFSTINRQVKKGTFPLKHKLSAQRIGFLKYQIDQWIEGKRDNW